MVLVETVQSSESHLTLITSETKLENDNHISISCIESGCGMHTMHVFRHSTSVHYMCEYLYIMEIWHKVKNLKSLNT